MNPYKHLDTFTNTNEIFIVDKNGIRGPNIFNKFSGDIISKPIPIYTSKFNFINSINLTNCDCWIIIDQIYKIKLESEQVYNINLTNNNFNLIYFQIEPHTNFSEWKIQINWSNDNTNSSELTKNKNQFEIILSDLYLTKNEKYCFM
jgi:hypothetical protein